MSTLHVLHAALTIAAAAALPTGDEATLRNAPIPQLQSWYLACDRASRVEALDGAAAIPCSIAAEALLQRGFGGDFAALLAWWRAQPTALASR